MLNFRRLIMVGLAAFLLTACGGGSGSGTTGGGATVGGGGETDNGENPVAMALFDIFDLVDLDGQFSAAIAINNAATPELVGFSADAMGTVKAVAWKLVEGTPSSPTALLPLSGNTLSAAYGINSAGVAVGESGKTVLIDEIPAPDHSSTAVFWSAGTVSPTALDTTGLFAGGDSAALAINGNGQIVGEADHNEQGESVAVYWADSSAAPRVLVHLNSAGSAVSSAYGISDNGIIAGESRNAAGDLQAVIWKPAGDGLYEAPTALTPLIDQVASTAFAIDPDGRIVGQAETADGTRYGVIWNSAGSFVADLGVHTAALAINNAERIVGHAADSAGGDQAVIWNAADPDDQQIIEAVFSQAYGINDAMHVAGMYENWAVVAVPR